MLKSLVNKPLALAVILFFISVSIIPSTGNILSFDDTTPPVTTHSLDPPEPNPPYGPSRGIVGKEYTFCTDLPITPEGEDYYLIWDWGDSNFSGWMGPYESGQTACASHTWNKSGEYYIRIKFKNVHGAEGNWSEPWVFTVANVTMLVAGIQLVIFGQITAFIANIGNETAYDVNYTVDVKVRGIVIRLEKMHRNGTKDTLNAESVITWTISEGMPFGLGWFKITITASAFNAAEDSNKMKGFILLYFVKVL